MFKVGDIVIHKSKDVVKRKKAPLIKIFSICGDRMYTSRGQHAWITLENMHLFRLASSLESKLLRIDTHEYLERRLK